MNRARARAGRALALLPSLVLASASCGEREAAPPPPPADTQGPTDAQALDMAALRTRAAQGLVRALDEPGTRRAFERSFEAVSTEPVVLEASERALARVGADPKLEAASDTFFAAVQDGEAVRAALVAYARENPELELAALSQGFVSYLDARLTRPALAERLAAVLARAFSDAGQELARALLVEAQGAEALAELTLARVEDPALAAELRGRLGPSVADDPRRLGAHLGERLEDPERAADPLIDFADVLASAPAGHELLAAILDHERCAALLADSLRRLLADEEVVAAARELFGPALADPLDEPALDGFEAQLRALLELPAVAREAATFLELLAREPHTRALLADYVRRHGMRESFDGLALDWMD